jgi:hypothetical protein
MLFQTPTGLVNYCGRSTDVMRFLLSGLLLCSCGCVSALLDKQVMKQNSMEHRVINQFADALEEENEAALRNTASVRFEEKAMRSNTAFRDMEILNLPKEELEVVEIEKVSDTKRHVVVREEGGTKYMFHLCKDEQKRRWVVDDVIFRQQKKGTKTSKSTTEVMDLLLTLREFLDTWKGDDRDRMLQYVSSDLKATLQELPEPWLKRLVGRIADEYETEMARRPDAQLNDKDAHVKLPAKNGFLLVKVIQQEDDEWVVADVEVHNRKLEDHPGSIRRQAGAMNTVARFLKSYGTQDHETLKTAVSSTFYDGALQFADLSMIPLPSPEFAPEDYEIRAFVGKLTIMIPDKAHVVRIDLVDPSAETALSGTKKAIKSGDSDGTAFVVRDVMIYDRKTEQQTLLSSAFTAPARATLFMSMLAERDTAMLRQISSGEFSRGIWNRLPADLATQLPLAGVPSGEMKLLSTRVRGAKTELEFEASSGSLLTVTLSDDGGQLRVDDVQFPGQHGEIASLKTQLELAVPMVELASAWNRSDLDDVRNVCSAEFNRLVWAKLEQLPDNFEDLPRLLLEPVNSMQTSPERAVVRLQDRSGRKATVELLPEKGLWVIDQVAFDTPDGRTVDIRDSFRSDLARQHLHSPKGTIQRVSHISSEPTITPSAGGVIRAHAESTQTGRGSLMIIPINTEVEPESAENADQVSAESRPKKARPKTSPVAAAPKTLVSPATETSKDEIVFFGKPPAAGVEGDKAAESADAGSSSADAESTSPKIEPGTLPSSSGGGLKPVPRIVEPANHPIEIPAN